MRTRLAFSAFYSFMFSLWTWVSMEYCWISEMLPLVFLWKTWTTPLFYGSLGSKQSSCCTWGGLWWVCLVLPFWTGSTPAFSFPASEASYLLENLLVLLGFGFDVFQGSQFTLNSEYFFDRPFFFALHVVDACLDCLATNRGTWIAF